MNDRTSLILAASYLLIVLLAAPPVIAAASGNASAVTISAVPPEGAAYLFGNGVELSGINTASNTTYLFLAGMDCSPAGSRMQSKNPCSTPVRDGDASTFIAVPVGNDSRWSWNWDTALLPPVDGTYTVYAENSPRDATRLGTAIFDSTALNFTSHTLTASVWPAAAMQGDTITISGKATGDPAPGVEIWVIGPEYSDRAVVGTDEKMHYSWEIDTTGTHLLNGTYHLFVEHPSADERFDFDLNGDSLFSNRIRSNIFTFRGNGRLYGEAAFTAFSAALNGPRTDDIIVPLSFTLGMGPSSAAVTPAGSLRAAMPDSSGNGSAALATGTSGNDSLPAVSANDSVVPATAGLPGTPVPADAGSDGKSPQLLLSALVLGTALVAGGGAAFVLLRRSTGGGIAKKAKTPARPGPGDGSDRNRTGGPGPGGTGQSSAGPATRKPPAPEAFPVQAFPRELAEKYTGIAPVGSGGFAMVYSAYRAGDNRKVAVKIPVRSDERTGRSFLHEIRVWETLHHPNIVEVLAANILPIPYVEMEYVPGSLEGLAKPVDSIAAARIVRGIAEGIRYAHAHRCIHRDIKPQNILLTETMGVKITDWGISKFIEERGKKTTLAGFSLSYAAPEQIAPERFGSTDERTDIWQIGAVFYELATGSTPFYGDSMMEIVNETLGEDPIPPSDYNPKAAPIEPIILRCLEKDPALRYQTADELLAALDEFLTPGNHQSR